ncbi:MAG: hypothetical protein WC824_06085 [Bacteroidota bacterium]
MGSIIQVIQRRCTEQIKKADELLQALEAFGWKDTRPKRINSRKEQFLGLDFLETIEVPASRLIPIEFIRDYHEWYSGALALIEGNMPSRIHEVIALHEGIKGGKHAIIPMIQLLHSDAMTFMQQITMASCISHMQSVVASIPAYMDARLYDVELAVAQRYVIDELTEAELLLKSGFVRAAGGMAGVLAERHLKLLCDRHHPPIKYAKSAGISKLNDLLKDGSVYDVAQWRKVQWMGDIRNGCDHAQTTEPRKVDVRDLISEVGKFVSLFVV